MNSKNFLDDEELNLLKLYLALRGISFDQDEPEGTKNCFVYCKNALNKKTNIEITQRFFIQTYYKFRSSSQRISKSFK